jgi:hypothetical protein
MCEGIFRRFLILYLFYMKAYDLVKSEFQFNHLDVSYEFAEYIDYVFIRNRAIFFVFKEGETDTKNPESFIKAYYKDYEFKKIIFLKQE